MYSFVLLAVSSINSLLFSLSPVSLHFFMILKRTRRRNLSHAYLVVAMMPQSADLSPRFLLIISKFMDHRLGSLARNSTKFAAIISYAYGMQLVKTDVEVLLLSRSNVTRPFSLPVSLFLSYPCYDEIRNNGISLGEFRKLPPSPSVAPKF